MPYLGNARPLRLFESAWGALRMNMDKLLETHLGYAARKAGIL